jgi:signal transduction histidine kinase
MKNRFWKTFLWDNLGFGDLPAEEYARRTTAVQLGFFTAIAGAIYCSVYVYLGFPEMALTSSSYIALFLLALAYLFQTRNFDVYKYVQLGLVLLAPLVNHLVVGGFVESSAVILASFLTPVIALTFVTRKTARLFFYFFIGVIVVGGVWELANPPQRERLPDSVITLFFVLNLISICAIIYLLIDGFLKSREALQRELQRSLDHLKTTQTQLIQSEKMASLGELTAGIAHEIQNPLNFVNNFSELSVELIEEVREERAKGAALNPAHLEDLLRDLEQNLQKIAHHGQRAASIVRGMLEHSRAASGQKQPTDLNALADEYLRLSYHGLRAKDKAFNATLKTDFDPALPRVEIAPQDVGRVLLNLFNNAFYAVLEKKKQQPTGYEPTVSVSTRRVNDGVEIRVTDNGGGIPEPVREKIFQPFFTTKPTGQGTGLGLSLSYDIIAKGHGGTLTVESEEGIGTTFTIALPIL